MTPRAAKVLFAVVFSLLFVSPSLAGKLPIPCTGDRIVKVVDIPAANQPKDMVVDLGYKFPGCFSDGEWVGYLGNSDKYIKLDEPRLQLILQMAGLKELPPTPHRWQYIGEAFGLELLLAGAIGAGIAWEVVKSRWQARKQQKLLEANLRAQSQHGNPPHYREPPTLG